MLRVRRRR